MGFAHGKNTKVYINEYDLTSYFNSIETPAEADTAETTTFGKDSKTYIPGLKDGTLSAEGFYDGSSDAVDEIMDAALGEENLVSWYPDTDALGSYGYAGKVINTSHNVSSTVDDATNLSVDGQITNGRERIKSLHALAEVDNEDFTGVSVDGGSASADGAVGYLHVTAIGVTVDTTVKIQHSSDNFAADTDDLITFTATQTTTSERIAVTGAVKQYVRAAVNVTGATEAITFNVGFKRI